MKLNDLRKGPLPAWPPSWSRGAFRGTDKLAIGPEMEGVLVDASANPNRPGLGVPANVGRGEAPRFIARGVEITVRLDGQSEPTVGILEWDGPAHAPTPDQVAEWLRSRIGVRIGDLGDVEIGER
jgi:hypothetical protein